MRDPLIKDVLDDLESRFSGYIISVFGIGSYFDEDLPPNWLKDDVDLVVIVDSLENIPKQDWTEVRYEKKQVRDKEIWIGFNSLEGVKNREQFREEFGISLEMINIALSVISIGLDLRGFWKWFKRKVHRTTEDLLSTDITGSYHLDSTLARRLKINLFFSYQDEIKLKVGNSWINRGFFPLPKSDHNFFPAPNSKIYVLNNKSSKVDYIEGRIKVYEYKSLIFNRSEEKKLKTLIPGVEKGDRITIHKLSENLFQFSK